MCVRERKRESERARFLYTRGARLAGGRQRERWREREGERKGEKEREREDLLVEEGAKGLSKGVECVLV